MPIRYPSITPKGIHHHGEDSHGRERPAIQEGLRTGRGRGRGRRGLYLVIQLTGAKSWAFRFRVNGKSAKLTLGGFDETVRKPVDKPVVGADLTLAEARKLAAEIDHERAAGTDVIVACKVAKLAARRKAIDDADNSYPVLLRRYVEEHARAQPAQSKQYWPAAKYL